jgi:hypothetical protein
MLVVCKIIVIQNGPSTHIIDATSFVQKQCRESCGGGAAVVGVIISLLIRPKLAKKLQITKPDIKGGHICAHSGKAVKPRCFLKPSLYGTNDGKFPAKTLSCGMRFCSEKGPLQSSTKSRAEHDFVPRNNPSKALQSPEQNLCLFQEATSLKPSKVQSGMWFCSEKRLIASKKKESKMQHNLAPFLFSAQCST